MAILLILSTLLNVAQYLALRQSNRNTDEAIDIAKEAVDRLEAR